MYWCNVDVPLHGVSFHFSFFKINVNVNVRGVSMGVPSKETILVDITIIIMINEYTTDNCDLMVDSADSQVV